MKSLRSKAPGSIVKSCKHRVERMVGDLPIIILLQLPTKNPTWYQPSASFNSMLRYKDILKIPSQSPPNVSQSHFISSFNDYSARCTWSKNAKTRCSFLSNNVRESESNCLVERSKKKEQPRLGLKLYYSTIYELREKKGKLKVQQLYTYVAYGETSALKLDLKKDNERLKKIHKRF